MFIVDMPLVVLAVRFTALPGVQLGTSTAPAGDKVRAQENETLPAYPFDPLTVTAELVDEPGLIDAGDAAAALSVNPAFTAALTVAVMEVVCVALPATPVTTIV